MWVSITSRSARRPPSDDRRAGVDRLERAADRADREDDLRRLLHELRVALAETGRFAGQEPACVRGVDPQLGVAEEMAHTSIRFGLGRFTTEEEVDYVIKLVVDKVKKLRALSPLYEMAKEGIDLKTVQWAAH